jgi:hypothetical protein
MYNQITSNENDIVRLFNELLPWTFNCRTLIDAARNGKTAECEDLIRLGVDINESDNYGNTAVWTSYFYEHLDTLFTLLQVDFQIDCIVFCWYDIFHSLVQIQIHVLVIFYVLIFIVHVHLEIEH